MPLIPPTPLRIVLVVIFLSLQLPAEYLPVKSYTIADGLMSDGEIVHMLQDSRGYLWICGALGISRFDGHTFRNYGTADGLPEEGAYRALETKDGTLWFGTSRGVARYVPDAGVRKRFVLYSQGDLTADDVHALSEDPRGGLWIGSSGGLYHGDIDAKGLHISLVLRPEPAGPEAPSVTQINSLLVDSYGALWAGTHYAGIYRILPGGAVEHYTTANGLPLNVNGLLLEDRTGRIWLTTPHGLLLLSATPKPGGWIVLESFDTSYGLSENRLRGLVETADGHIWFGSDMGLAEFDGRQLRTYTTENGLSEIRISSVVADRQGNLWVGTMSRGVMRLARNGFITLRETDGISSGVASTFLETSGASPVVVTTLRDRFPIQVWNGRSFIPVTPRFPAEVKVFGWGSAQQFLRDHLGEWWAATFDGLCRFPATTSARQLAGLNSKRLYTVRDGLPGNNINALFEDSVGDIWIGIAPRERSGLARWRRSTGSIEDLSRAPGSIQDETAVSFVEDSSGAIWIGFLHGGLSRYRDGHFTSFTAADGLPPGTIHLYLDPSDRLWGAAGAGGVFRVDRRDSSHPQFVRFTTENGLSTNWANAITSDRNGMIYAGTLRGVDRIDPASGHISHWNTSDGLANNVVMSAFRDRAGDLWFGTQNGLSKLTVSRNPAPAPPPVRITEVRVDDRPMPLSDFGESSVSEMEIHSRQNHVQISFAGINLNSALRFQYKLDGSGRDWSPPAAEQSVVYPGFPAGKFRFLVRALNADDAVSPVAAAISFNVLPPIWQRWWFILLASASVMIAIWQWQRYRIAQLLAIERLRTRIATDLHDDIGTSLSHIAVLTELARRKIGEPPSALAEYLAQITAVSQDAAAAMGDVVWAIDPQRDSLHDLVLRMRRFAADVLSARDIECRFQAPETEGSRKLDSDIRRQLYLVFKEAINNVSRHAQATLVHIDLRIEREGVVLEIVDNGKGFDPSQPNFGHGLDSLRNRAQRLRGSFFLQSSPGKGTQLSFRVPLGG